MEKLLRGGLTTMPAEPGFSFLIHTPPRTMNLHSSSRRDFLKLGAEQLRALGESAITLAESEGLSGHARSVAIRLNRGGGS